MPSVKSASSPDSFFGRQEELDELLGGLEAAARGEGRLFLIGGEPGIGKSRLADEVASHGKTLGATVLWGKCWEAGGAPAYWPWMQCLRAYFRAREPEALRDQLGPGAADIAQMLPEVETLVPDLPPLPSVDPESARFRLFDSTTTFLRNAADTGVLVMVIDDLHAIDTASLLFLRFLASQIADMRILLLATYRDVELTPDHPLTSSITELVREPATRRLVLVGLTESDVALLVQRMAGLVPSRSLVSKLHHQTKGNPLFLTESIRMLAADGRLVSVTEASGIRVSIPGAIRDVILRRLDQLGEACRQTMTLASVLGPEFSTETLGRLAGLPIVELGDVVDEAAGSGLLVEVGGAGARFRFSHDLVREVLYDSIPPLRRAGLHWTAGDVLEDIHTADLVPHLGAIAHHYYEGAPAGGSAKATEYARQAAEYSARQLAYEETVRLYQVALQATELEKSPDATLRCELMLGLGDAQMRSGAAPAAKETFIGAAGIARRVGLPDHLARAALGYGGHFVWARAGHDRQLISLLEGALAGVGEKDTSLRARLLARLAGALRDQPTLEVRNTYSREAVDIARRIRDPATLAFALDGRYSAIWAPDTDGERLEVADEIVRIAEEIGDAERALQGHHYRLCVFLERGDLPAVRRELESNTRLAKELRQPAQRWYVTATEAIVALLEGRFDDAERLSAEAFSYQGDDWMSLGVEVTQRYCLRLERGSVAGFEDTFRRMQGDYASWPWIRIFLLHVYSELDRRAEARGLLEAVAAENFRDLPWDNDWLLGVSMIAEVTVRLRDRERAAMLYEMIVPYADRTGFGQPEYCTGSLSRPLGLLASLLGRVDLAVHHFEDAIVMNEGMGARPWVAHCQHDLADVLMSRDLPGDQERAERLLREALETATGLGMLVLEAKIRALLGDDTQEALEPVAPATEGVFRREGEYWSVVFEGRGVRLRDAKGMRHLARLLAQPGREFHVLDLVRMEEGAPERVGDPGEELLAEGLGDAGDILDPQAKAAYKQRLAELEEDLTEAESWNDSERVSRVKEEIEFLTRELAGAIGLAGRDRRAASSAERARLNVSRAIRAAMTRTSENHPELGKHLDTAINTGLYCSYTPDSRLPITWSL